jgi:hypothetical protein
MIQYTKEYIAKLLDKYMDGTSTLDEETILSQYFRGKNIPEEWLCYKQMFEEIEAMEPQPKTHNRWAIWSIAAAAVVAGVLYLAVSPRQTGFVPTEPLTAQADTTNQQTIAPADTVTAQPAQTAEPQQPVKAKKRSLRKSEPTIHDYNKAYALMAEAIQRQRDVERQIAQAEQEIIEAQLAAYGYIPVMQEDGTIIYINEQTELIAYEE